MRRSKGFKKFLCIFITVITFVMAIPPATANATDWTAYTVHITRTGSKYHMAGCSYLKSDIPINILDAVNSGYTPCSRCNPPYPSVTNEPAASDTTQSETYVGYYASYTQEYNRRVENNELLDSLKTILLEDVENTVANLLTDEDLAFYNSLSYYDQIDFKNALFIQKYDSFMDYLSYRNELIFDSAYYYAANVDLQATIEYDEDLLYDHFFNHGMSEGRQGSAAFNVHVYKDKNPDLIPLYGTDLKAYYKHYLNYGQYENRIAN